MHSLYIAVFIFELFHVQFIHYSFPFYSIYLGINVCVLYYSFCVIKITQMLCKSQGNINCLIHYISSIIDYMEFRIIILLALPVIYLKRVRRVFAHLGPGNIRNPMALSLKCCSCTLFIRPIR